MGICCGNEIPWGQKTRDFRLPISIRAYILSFVHVEAHREYWAHIDDIPCRGEGGVAVSVRRYLERRLGASKYRETNFAQVGVELPDGKNFSVTMTTLELTDALQSIPSARRLWASRRRPLKMEDLRTCQCTLGELCLLATVSRRNKCARPAQLASKVDSLQGSDIYRINNHIETAKGWQQAVVLKYQSGPRPRTLTLAGWSDAGDGD